MKLLRTSAVKAAAQKACEALDLLTVDLEALKKMYLNGHHDLEQVLADSEIKPPDKKKPNGKHDH